MDFILVQTKSGNIEKRFKAFCCKCGSDRGYKEKSALNKQCVACRNRSNVSEETKAKISQSKIGHKKTPEQIEKSAKWHRGKVVSRETKDKLKEARRNNPRPGGATKGSNKSESWRNKVKQTHAEKYGLTIEEHNAWIAEKDDRRYFKSSGLISLCYERDDYTCNKCGERGGRLNAHHIESWKFYPEKRMELDNLVTLCTRCHKEFHKQYGNGTNKPNNREQLEKYLSC